MPQFKDIPAGIQFYIPMGGLNPVKHGAVYFKMLRPLPLTPTEHAAHLMHGVEPPPNWNAYVLLNEDRLSHIHIPEDHNVVPLGNLHRITDDPDLQITHAAEFAEAKSAEPIFMECFQLD